MCRRTRRPAPHALWLVYALGAVAQAVKRCDIFNVPGRGRMCGPAAFIAGFGKCGTNAFMAFTQLHPHVKWPTESEIDFDPQVILPVELIRRHSPGVLPSDPNVWMIKHPALAIRGGPLAKRLLAHYPLSALFMVACDPTLLPFRWYRHYIERTVSYQCYGNTCTDHKKGDPAGPLDVLRAARPFGVTSLVDLYSRIYPFDQRCVRNAHDEEMLRFLRQVFFIGASLFASRVRCVEWDPADPLSFVRTRNDEVVLEYINAGYILSDNLDVFFMEGWATSGAHYMERIHRLLQIPLEGYPWAKTNHFQPVYSILQRGHVVGEKSDPQRLEELSRTQLDNLSLVPIPRVSVEAARRECCSWEHLLGYKPPWDSCQGAGCGTSSPSPPTLPPLDPRPPSPTLPPPVDSLPPPSSPLFAAVPSPSPPLQLARNTGEDKCEPPGRICKSTWTTLTPLLFPAACFSFALAVILVVRCRSTPRGPMVVVQTSAHDGSDDESDADDRGGDRIPCKRWASGWSDNVLGWNPWHLARRSAHQSEQSLPGVDEFDSHARLNENISVQEKDGESSSSSVNTTSQPPVQLLVDSDRVETSRPTDPQPSPPARSTRTAPKSSNSVYEMDD